MQHKIKNKFSLCVHCYTMPGIRTVFSHFPNTFKCSSVGLEPRTLTGIDSDMLRIDAAETSDGM